jgi:hypothetical protein
LKEDCLRFPRNSPNFPSFEKFKRQAHFLQTSPVFHKPQSPQSKGFTLGEYSGPANASFPFPATVPGPGSSSFPKKSFTIS